MHLHPRDIDIEKSKVHKTSNVKQSCFFTRPHRRAIWCASYHSSLSSGASIHHSSPAYHTEFASSILLRIFFVERRLAGSRASMLLRRVV